MSLKYVGWCALCVCISAVAVTEFSEHGRQASQSINQSVAASPTTNGITFVSVNGASPAGFASVTIQATPGAECSIRYITPHGTISRAAGLDNQLADSGGKASWTWKIGSKTEPGTGRVTVTCGGASATASIGIGQ
jgi:hypothetical protein